MRQREMKLKFLLEEALYLNMVGKCFYTLTCIIFDLVEWSMAFPFLDVQLVLRPLNYDIELRKKTKVITYYILGQIYYILRYFGFLHFASKVITFWVIEVITFCIESYYILGYYYILCQKLLHFGSIITFCGVTWALK